MHASGFGAILWVRILHIFPSLRMIFFHVDLEAVFAAKSTMVAKLAAVLFLHRMCAIEMSAQRLISQGRVTAVIT
jgi:hypothetical protein